MELKERLNTKVQNITESTNPMVTNATYLALKNNALEIIQQNLKNQPLSFSLFDIVKSPSGGSTVFSVPGLS